MKAQQVTIARVLPRLVGLGFLIAGATLGAQNQPLPNKESFLLETRKHLETDSTLQSSYVYVETRRTLKCRSWSPARVFGLASRLGVSTKAIVSCSSTRSRPIIRISKTL